MHWNYGPLKSTSISGLSSSKWNRMVVYSLPQNLVDKIVFFILPLKVMYLYDVLPLKVMHTLYWQTELWFWISMQERPEDKDIGRQWRARLLYNEI